MPIIFNCTCGKKLSAQESHAGFTVRCPNCGRDMAVPETTGGAAAPRGPHIEPDDEYRERRLARDGGGMSGLAVASLICGIVGFCVPLLGLVGIVLGILGLVNISGSQGRLRGTGLAIGGIVASVLSLLIILPVLFYATQRVRESANRMLDASNMRQLGIAMHNYHNDYNQMPPQAIMSKDGKPLLSWRVLMLPYMDQNQLFKQFHLDEPWDSPHNIQFLDKMPKIFVNPNRPAPQEGYTYYQVFFGQHAVFDPTGKVTLAAISAQDGTSNTIMLAEAADAVPWTKPDDMPFDFNPGAPLPKLGNPSAGGYHVLFADGSVRYLKRSYKPEDLRSLIDCRDGRLVPIE